VSWLVCCRKKWKGEGKIEELVDDIGAHCIKHEIKRILKARMENHVKNRDTELSQLTF
jgi:hypothetical protein